MIKTAEDQAYTRLRVLLLDGALPTGEFLSQRMLATSVGTSVVSVRPALRRLESEGLLENVPKWGVRIPSEDALQVQQRYELREILEMAAVRLAIPHIDAVTAERLLRLAVACDSIADNCEDTDSDAAVRRFAAAHEAFHAATVELAGNPLLLDSWRRATGLNFMLSNARRGWQKGRDRMCHRELADAILSGDLALAESTLHTHIARGLEGELNALAAEQSTSID